MIRSKDKESPKSSRKALGMVYGVAGVPPSNRGQDARDTTIPKLRSSPVGWALAHAASADSQKDRMGYRPPYRIHASLFASGSLRQGVLVAAEVRPWYHVVGMIGGLCVL
jgi:hypothetical protein